MSALSAKLRAWRGVTGEPPRGAFSQGAAAAYLGVPLDTYQNWEQGRTGPGGAFALAAILSAIEGGTPPGGTIQEQPRKTARTTPCKGRAESTRTILCTAAQGKPPKALTPPPCSSPNTEQVRGPQHWLP